MYGASKLMKTLNIQDALEMNPRICKPKQEFSPDPKLLYRYPELILFLFLF